MKTAGTGIVFFSLFIFSSSFAQGVLTPQPISVILKKLKSDGYANVKQVKLEGDQYQITAMSSDGGSTILRVNSFNGDVVDMKKMDSHISMLEVVDKIESLGYSSITFIEAQDDHYQIQAIGPDGKKVELKVDATNGALTKNYVNIR